MADFEVLSNGTLTMKFWVMYYVIRRLRDYKEYGEELIDK